MVSFFMLCVFLFISRISINFELVSYGISKQAKIWGKFSSHFPTRFDHLDYKHYLKKKKQKEQKQIIFKLPDEFYQYYLKWIIKNTYLLLSQIPLHC